MKIYRLKLRQRPDPVVLTRLALEVTINLAPDKVASVEEAEVGEWLDVTDQFTSGGDLAK